MHEMGIETGIDLGKLMKIASVVEEALGHPLPGQVMKAGPRLDLHSMGDVQTAVG